MDTKIFEKLLEFVLMLTRIINEKHCKTNIDGIFVWWTILSHEKSAFK
jgi:hypothetical protein